MTNYATIDANGRVIRFGGCGKSMVSIQPHDEGLGEQVIDLEEINQSAAMHPSFDITHWFDGAQFVPRPTLAFDKLAIAADGVEIATLTGLPDPCTVLVDGVPQEVTGGVLEFSAATPGTYKVEAPDPFPAQAYAADIVAA